MRSGATAPGYGPLLSEAEVSVAAGTPPREARNRTAPACFRIACRFDVGQNARQRASVDVQLS